ncbi:adenylate/guanylate cyclase domain-containing protein [Hydrogenophaga pseudoflava]|uniref:adenylate/guanylate cyclase domain-containing protein n=1 Tax=Hydrogenophaga pseudoflava TaxID=47421 RepID=UPI0027E4FDF5|nr:adenylate/guanylate cyclase domain-containing protein [Hydrogenophaga pseudoflava]MDQ7744032.1 adenylate/guanylate cyclase domain-containing protein [Hydrogenophaga pseudoflava]
MSPPPPVPPVPRSVGTFTLRFTLVAAFTGITLLVSLVIGAATATLVGDFVRDEFRLRMADLAAVAATQIDVQAHQRLQAPRDQDTPDYRAMRDHLREIRDRGTHIRFIYTTRQRPDGQVVFVVDAEEKPEDFSALGDVYADVSPELRAALAAPRGATKSFVTQRFYTDAWGTWMSAYAPLYLPDGRLEAVLGLDMSADRILQQERRYQYALWGACALLALLLMPVAYWMAHRIRRPLSRLESDMRKVRQFDLESTPPIRSRVIEINRMVEQLESMRSGLRSFQRYVPAELVRRLIARGVDAELGGTQQEMTFFMSDVEGFTTLSERLPPDELVHHLGDYLTAVSGSLLREGATVDQYIGDAVLAFWNAPEPVADHPQRACDAALAVQEAVARLNLGWERQGGRVAFRTRIGINTGDAIVGNIGSSDRMSYTVIGDQVNLVSRLEATNKFYGTSILLSEHTQQRVHAQFVTRLVDQLVAYGRSRPIRVYELLGRRGAVAPDRLAVVTDYEAAFAHYQRRDFGAAMALLECHPEDPPSRVLLARCRRYAEQPPLAEWDGSFLFTSK